MAANKHTNKLKIQNYAYEINDSGALVQATEDGNYFEIPQESYFGRNGDYPLIEAMDIDWRPYKINGEPVVTTHDVLDSISQNIERLDYLDDAYTYTMDIIEENEEITAQALTNLDTRVLNIENVDLPDLDDRVEKLETTYVSHEFLSNIGYVKTEMSYNEYGYAKLGRNTNIAIGGRVYPIGMEASTGRLGVEIPYQPGDNTITNIGLNKEGSGNYVKEIKLSHVDNNPILSYTLTVSYSTLPTLSATGTNSGLVINGISASEHSIAYSYTNVPSYEYIANNYETITYVRDAYTYIIDTIEENEQVTAAALTNLDTRVTNIEDDYVAYSDLNSYIGAHSYITHVQVNNALASYINYGTATNTGYVIGKIGMNGHILSYAYVAVPTYEYLHNGYVNNVTSTKSGSGNIVKEITVSKTTTGGINSYVINVAYSSIAATDTYTYVKLQNGANDSGKYVSGIEMSYSGSNPTSYEFKVSYTDLPSVSFDNNAATAGQAATGFKIDTTDDHKIQVSYSYFVTPKYLKDFSYINKVQGNGNGNVINAIKQDGQTVTYAYGTVFDILSGTKGDNNVVTNITASGNTITITYSTAQSLITIPNIPTNSYIKNVGLKGTGSTSYTITLSYTYGSGTNSTSSVIIPEANASTAGVVKVTSQYHYTPSGGTSTNTGTYINENQKAITGITITKDDKGHVTGFSYVYTDIPSYNYVDKKIADLVNGAPSYLDTLEEFARVLGTDSNFSTTILGLIGETNTNVNSYINGIEVSGGNDSGYKITISYHVGNASNTQTKNVTIPVMSTANYGVAKLGDSTSLTIGSKVYGVGMTSGGQLAVSVPWDDNTNDNDNTISYVTHKGNGSGNAINGIIVTYSGTNPVSYTVTYSYTTLPSYDYLKQSYVSYANFNSYIASLGYVNNQMTTSKYGYAKLGNSNTLTIGNKIYGVGVTSSGQLAVEVPWENTNNNDNTISYVTHKGNGTGNFINGIIVTKSGTNPVTYTVTYSYGTALTSSDISNLIYAYYDVLTKGIYSATDALQVGKGYRNDATKTSSSYSAYSYSDIYVPYMTSAQYGVAKLGDSTTLTIGSTSTDTIIGVGKTSDGKLAVKIPKAEQVQDTNNISYVIHQGNGEGNVITGITVAHSGTNPVTYTVTYSYGTAFTQLSGAKETFHNGVSDISVIDNNIISISYDTFLTEQSLENYVTKSDLSAQGYVSSVMTDTTFGYAKVGAPGTIDLSDTNIYPVAITADGKLGVQVDIDDTYTYIALNTIQNTGTQVVAGLELTPNIGSNPITYTLKASYVNIDELLPEDNYHDPEFDSGLLVGSAQGSVDDLYVPYMTNTQYGVAKSYYTYNGQAAVSNDTRNYGLSIDNQGHAYVNVPWVGGEVQLQSSTTGTVVSNITKNGNVLTISYTDVPDETQLVNAITELNDRIDDMFGYIETGNGRALRYDPQSGAAYVDLTGFSGGGGGGTSSINSVAFTSTNTGSQLTINDGSNHVGTLNVMTNTSYGVAKARVLHYIQSQEEYQTGKGIKHTSDLDPTDSDVKNYMVKVFGSYQPYGQSGNTNLQGHMFVTIPTSDFGGGGGSGSGGGDTITGISNSADDSGRKITITTDQNSFYTTLPKATSSTYGLLKVKSSYSSSAPSVASSGHYYPLQMSSDGVGVVRVPTSTGTGSGGDTITAFSGASQTDATGGSLLTITTNATSWTARVPKATSTTYGLIKAAALGTNVTTTTASSGDYYPVQVKPNGDAVVRVPAGGSSSNAVEWEANSGVSSPGPIKKIKVVSSAGTDINTLYIVI